MQHILQKIKSAISGDVFVALVIIFVGLSSFGLGRLSGLDGRKMEVRMLEPGQHAAVIGTVAGEEMVSPVPEVENLGGQYVASKKGT